MKRQSKTKRTRKKIEYVFIRGTNVKPLLSLTSEKQTEAMIKEYESEEGRVLTRPDDYSLA